MLSTNGIEFFPDDLKSNFKNKLDSNYDMQLTYTAMKNFKDYLSHGKVNRFGIWNYETTVLPVGFAKQYKFADKFLPSSEFSKEIFMENGIPESGMEVVPHGVDVNDFNCEPYALKTKKKYRILANIAQPHQRKNLPGLLDTFGKAFSLKDDVCLVLKVVDKKAEASFEVSFKDIFAQFKNKYKNHAEIEIIREFIPNIASLYKSCNIVFTMSRAENFWLPSLEGLAANCLIVAPRYGGYLDFLNDSNSILIDGKKVMAKMQGQYWESSIYAGWFDPSIDDAVNKLRHLVNNYDSLHSKLMINNSQLLEKYSWLNVSKQIIKLCK